MFAYCGNNPVVREDTSGTLWHIAFGATLGGVLSGVSKFAECIISRESIQTTLIKTAISATYGAIGGGLAATGIGVFGQAIIGGVIGAAEYTTTQLAVNESIDAVDFAVSTVSGLVGGAGGGDGAAYGSKFMQYHRSQFTKNASLNGVGEAISKLVKHTWNWTKSNLKNATREGVVKAFAVNKIAGLMINRELELLGM